MSGRGVIWIVRMRYCVPERLPDAISVVHKQQFSFSPNPVLPQTKPEDSGRKLLLLLRSLKYKIKG